MAVGTDRHLGRIYRADGSIGNPVGAQRTPEHKETDGGVEQWQR